MTDEMNETAAAVSNYRREWTAGVPETLDGRPAPITRRFVERRFVVTGAADGIGLATTRRLVAEGARVAMVDLNVEKARAAAAEFGEAALVYRADVSNEPDVQQAFTAAADWLGGLDGLVNSAGIVDFGITHELPIERWQRVIDVVLTGTFITNKAALPYLLESGGAVVNVGSIGGLRGKAWQAAYSAAKAGVTNLTRALACEYVGRVRFNVLAAGMVPNDIVGNSGTQVPPEGVSADEFMEEFGRRVIAPKRGADAAEMAGVITFLLSDDASYMEGSTVVVDGATLA